jgi:Domain of unknown function (DUF4145)
MNNEEYIQCNVNILFNGDILRASLISIEDLPDECPFCHQKIHPKYLTGFCFHDQIDKFTALFLCPDYNCSEYFIIEYFDDQFDEKNNKLSGKPYIIDYILGGNFIPEKFDLEIRKISPKFIKIYNQALNADSMGFNEISGIGFRRAIEFLMKDFAIRNNQNEKDKIARMHLPEVINSYIEDDDIRQMAHRAVWLGNDEAHYMREWDNYSIKDLKDLIKITSLWMGLRNRSERYKTGIAPKKKKNGQNSI